MAFQKIIFSVLVATSVVGFALINTPSPAAGMELSQADSEELEALHRDIENMTSNSDKELAKRINRFMSRFPEKMEEFKKYGVKVFYYSTSEKSFFV